MSIHPWQMNRRNFLASGLGVGARALWPNVGLVQETQLHGAPRRLLSTTFAPLAGSLAAHGAWRPFPTAGEAGWTNVPAAVRDEIISAADAVNTSPWPGMLATDELEFKRNGNRSRFEAISFGRRARLGQLVLAECMTKTGKYVDQIANGVWLICEESFWGVPAHLGAQKLGVGLADEAEPIIELFGAETAAIVGWIVYLLEPQLTSVSPRIVERVHMEAKRRILDPYFARADFSWMGLSDGPHHLNNWNPWINSNILTANLLLEKDAARRESVVAKICHSVDEFLGDYSPDAGCEEGPGYWSRSAGSFYDCCWTLISAHGGKGDAVLKHPFIRAMGHYICNVHIAGNDYVNYGDAHIHDMPSPDLTYRYGRGTGDDDLAQLGAYDATRHDPGVPPGTLSAAITNAHAGGPSSLSRSLAKVLSASEITKAPVRDALPRDAWYPALGLMTGRRKEGSAQGFFVACQAASNGRSHAHNDSGSFILFHNGEPIFIDVGPEAYTAKTFGKDRYTLWPMQSAFHNLPTIGGVMQHEGDAYRASDLHYQTSERGIRFSTNLATAYPKEAGAQAWIRTLALDRTRDVVTITEDFMLDRPTDVMLSLMTATEPMLQAQGVKVGDAFLTFDTRQLKPEIEKIVITDEGMKHSWGGAVYRLKLHAVAPVAKAIWSMEVRPA